MRYPSLNLHPRLAALALVATALAAAPLARADTFTFVGTHNADWNYQLNGQYANWMNGRVSTGNASYTDKVHLGQSLRSLRLDSNMNFSSTRLSRLYFDQIYGVDLRGNALRFAGGGGIDVGSAARHTMSNAVVLNDSASADPTFTVNVATDASLTATGFWRGTGSLVKTGAGTLNLSSSSAYTGGTVLRGGTVQLFDDAALGTNGDLTLAGGSLDLGASDITVRELSLGNGAAGGSLGLLYSTGITPGRIILTRNLTFRGAPGAATDPALLGANIQLDYGQHTFGSNGAGSSGLYDVVLGGALSGVGGIDVAAPNLDLVLTQRSTYAGATNLNAGRLYLATENALPTATALTVSSGGLLSLSLPRTESVVNAGSHSQTVGSLAGSGLVVLGSATLTVGGLGADTAFSGGISGTGALTKAGAGVLTLSGNNTYGGATTVGVGTLRATTSTGALSPFSQMTVGASGTLELTDEVQSVAGLNGTGRVLLGSATLKVGVTDESSSYGGTISGTGGLTKSGAGALTLSGASSYSGDTAVQAGALRTGRVGALSASSAVAIEAPGTLDLAGYDQATRRLTGAGRALLGGATLTVGSAVDSVFAGAVSGPGTLAKVGAGTLDLRNADLLGFSGAVRLERGTLHFDQSRSGLYSGTFTGEAALLKTGSRSLTLANAPANSGGVRVAAGALEVDGAGAFVGGLTVDRDATFLNSSSGVLKVGERTFVQGDVLTTRGSTTVFSGLVSGAGGFGGFGAVRFDGGYSPGNSPASVAFQGDLALSASNTLTMELGGTAMGTGYDHLSVAGTAFLGGSLNVAYYGGFAASAGQSFDLFDLASTSGTFSSVSLPRLSGGLAWDTSALYATGTIRVQSVPEPASLLALGLGAAALLRRRRRQTLRRREGLGASG